jgi:uncharacterized membrane protein YgdD (TMEM256/DUF423 family)
MIRTFLIFGTILGGLGVIIGAMGAHLLKSKLQPEQLQILDTGVRYQMYHALALIILVFAGDKLNPSWVNYSGWLFLAGTLFFSGSIYLLACSELLGIQSWKSVLGPITPLGGLCFIAGWICLAVSSLK